MRLLESLGLRLTPVVARALATGGGGAGHAESGSKAAAQQLKGQLQAKLAEWRAQYSKVAPAQAWLKNRIAASQGAQKAELEAKKTELDQKAKEAARRIAQASTDIAALTDPRSDASTYNAILARQKSALKIEPSVEVDRHDGALEKKRGETQVTRTTTAYANGNATTRTDEATTTIGAGSYTKKHSHDKETVGAEGRKSSSYERSTTASKSGIAYEEKVHHEEETDGESTSVDKTVSAEFGAEGATRTDTHKKTAADGSSVTDTQTSAIERGEGKVGSKQVRSRTKTDAEGNEHTNTTTSKHGVTATQDGIGAYGEREVAVDRKHKFKKKGESDTDRGALTKGEHELTTHKGLKLNSNVVYDIKKVSDDPPTYDLSVTVSLGVEGSASVKHEGDRRPGLGASASGSVDVVMTRHYTLPAAEASAYDSALRAASGGKGGGDTYDEFAIIRMGKSKNWNAARDMYLALQGKALDPAELAKLKAGESKNLAAKKKASVGASADLGAVGVEAGYEVGHDESMNVKKEEDGKLTYDMDEADSHKVSGGAKVSVGAASGGFSLSKTNTTSNGMKISIDPAAKNAAEMQKALAACKNQKDRDAFASKYPESVQERTTGKGTAATQAVSAGIGAVKANVAFGQSFAEQTTIDKDGKRTKATFTGASDAGAGLAAGKIKLSASSSEKLVGQVDANDEATVEVSQTDTSTNVGKLLRSHVPGMKDPPAGRKGALTALAGGGEEPDTEDKDIQGIKLKNSDLKLIGKLARSNKRAWDTACISPNVSADWERARSEIAKDGGSSASVARALAKFVGGDSGRSDVINRLVRPTGNVSSGSRYEYPGKLAQRKDEYDSLVIESSEATLDALAKGSGGAQKAAESGAEMLLKLDSLYIAVANAEGFSKPAVQGEMLGAVIARKQKIQARLRVLGGGKADELSKTEVMGEYNDLLRTCSKHKQNETACFDKIVAFFKGRGPDVSDYVQIDALQKQLRNMHASWSPQYEDMAGLAQEHGFGKGANWWKYKPDTARLARAMKGNPGEPSPAQPETADFRKKK